jgi:DNA-binding MarR family transcriptional regulator
MPLEQPVSVAERLNVLLQRCELAGQYQRAARARQLAVQQVEVMALEHLVMAGGMTPGELGHRLGLTSGGVTALTGRLIDAGCVAREAHPTDRRMRVLTATEAGRDRLAAQLAPVLAPASTAASWLSEDDAAVVTRFLEGLALLKEREAALTPGPEPERIRDGRRRIGWGQLAPARYDPVA